jgi:hypothetical protein
MYVNGHRSLTEDEVGRLKGFVGKEVELFTHTMSHIGPIGAPTSSGAASRDDWDQYGGYPGYMPGSGSTKKIVLLAIDGFENGGKVFPTRVIGSARGKGRGSYPLKTGPISYIDAIKCGDVFLTLCDKSILDAPVTRQRSVQIVP